MKTPKPASIYKKPVPEKAFEKRYSRQLAQLHDRDFLISCFTLADGVYTLRADLDKDAIKRLNKLAKDIKANRGFFKTGPLVGVVLLVVGLVVFSLFFMNPLLERAGESALSSAFGARAEISGLRFSLLGLRCTISSLSVADRDSPMTNLFETGRLAFRMNPRSLLRGRVYIEEISAASLAFGTPRKFSGALPDADVKKEADSAKAATGPALVDFSHFDAGALLEREKGQLSSTAAWEKAGTAYRDAAERWKVRYESSGKAVEALNASSRKALAIDAGSIKTIAEATKAISDVKAALADAQKVSKEAREVASGTESDWNAAVKLEKDAASSVGKDLTYLKSFIDLNSGSARSALEPVVEGVLSDKGRVYLHYGERGLEVLGNLAKESPKKAEKPQKARLSKGRDVEFPSQALPRFRLGKLYSSFNDGSRDWVVDLREVSSSPSLVPTPTSLSIDVREAGSAISVKAVADLRSDAVYSLSAQGSALKLNLGNSFEKLGIDSFRGTGAFDLKLAGTFAGSVEASSSLHIKDPVLREQDGVIGKAIADGVRNAGSIDLSVGYKASDFSLSSNLDRIVSGALASAAAGYARKAEAELNAALQGYVDKELKGKLGSKADLEKLTGGAKGNAASSDKISQALDSKVKELEAKVKKLGTGAIKGVSLPKLR